MVPEDYPRSQWSKARRATLEEDDGLDLAKEVEKLKEKYPDVFDHEVELKIMNGDAVKIELKTDTPIKPLHINVPRRVPYAEEAAAKAELDRLVKLGVLEYVPGSSKWVSPMSFVPKPDGKMRLVGDNIICLKISYIYYFCIYSHFPVALKPLCHTSRFTFILSKRPFCLSKMGIIQESVVLLKKSTMPLSTRFLLTID